MQKKERHEFIRRMVEDELITRQQEIVHRLTARGLDATQASVSRDLDELGIIKEKGVYRIARSSSSDPSLRPSSFLSVGSNLIVGKCASGLASAITVRIDSANIPEIVGTIAGDDTVFIAVADKASQDVVEQKLWGLFR